MNASKLVYSVSTDKPKTTFVTRDTFCEFHKKINCRINNYCSKRAVNYETDLKYINLEEG